MDSQSAVYFISWAFKLNEYEKVRIKNVIMENRFFIGLKFVRKHHIKMNINA
jgi:hypothetical protein